MTNTPWKERHLYPVALQPAAPGLDGSRDRYQATFAKALHVSPFLGQDHRYHLSVASAPAPVSTAGRDRLGDTPAGRRVTVALDVLASASPDTSPAAGAPLPPSCIRGAGGVETTDDPDNAIKGRGVLTTRLVVDQYPVERTLLTLALRHNTLPTHRVSLGIHRQAWRLWRQGVPVVAHPRRRAIDAARIADPARARR